MKQAIAFTAVAVMTTVSGCTWVAPTEAGAGVQILTAVPDAACARVGRVTASTRATLAGMARSEDKIGRELDALAQDQAASLDANVIVAASDITSGRREYEAFRCPGA